MSWPLIELGEICKPKQHKTVPSSELLDDGYVVYGANGPIGFYSKYTHDRTTVAITCRGATCGTINVVPPKSYITGNAMALDDLDENRVSLPFLRYVLEHQGFQAVINGAAQPQITRAPLLTYKIPLPPLEEQKRIAGILDQADALRRLRTRALDKLNTLGQTIFHEMFGDMTNNSMGWADDEHLEDIADIASGITKGRKTGDAALRSVPYMAVSNVQDQRLKMDVVKEIEATDAEIARYLLKQGDLLLTEGGDPDKLGRGCLWNNELPECIHQNHVFRVRVKGHRIFLALTDGSGPICCQRSVQCICHEASAASRSNGIPGSRHRQPHRGRDCRTAGILRKPFHGPRRHGDHRPV